MLRHRTVDAIITDIEGTTTSLSFVKDTLFPYAKQHLKSFVEKNAENPDVKQCLMQVAETLELENNMKDVDLAQSISVLLSWIDQDRKHTALKTLQGFIWKEGYDSGEIQGHIYKDVPLFFKHLNERSVDLYVYSSGSVAAQVLLFRHTEYGDMTPFIKGYFDTTTGPKKVAASYAKIIDKIKTLPEHTLFVSDVQEELDAAGEAGLQTMQLLREGVSP